MSRPESRRPVLAAAAIVLAACTASPPATPTPGSPQQASPTLQATPSAPEPLALAGDGLAAVACPAIITADSAECAVLTVPEDPQLPDGRTIDLHVTLIRAEERTADDPVIHVGADLPWAVYHDSYVDLPNRVGRDVVLLDPRGTGLSEPNLACTELWALRESPSDGGPAIDATSVGAIAEAVAACRARLAADGIDVSQYGVAAMAADVEALAVTLGLDAYNLASYGSTSRVAFEVIRRYPDRIRSAILSSPDVPELDWFTESARGTRGAVEQLAAACDDDEACRTAFGNVGATLEAAMSAFDASPEVVPFGAGAITVDGALYGRIIRTGLGLADWLPVMPAAIHSLTGPDARSFPDDAPVVSAVASDPTLSHGYVPAYNGPADEPTPPEYADGVLYTIVCADELPFVDATALADVVGEDGWLRATYLDSAWDDVCAAWDVPAGDGSVNEPVVSDVPTLMLVGALDPFTVPAAVAEAEARFSAGEVFVFATSTHNPLGGDGECARSIRNTWIAAPTEPPVERCHAAPAPIRFVTE